MEVVGFQRIGELIEIEIGKGLMRSVDARAAQRLAQARKGKAQADRLSRDVALISRLMATRIPLVP